MLLTQKNYTQEAMDIAANVSKDVELRHAKWLVSINHHVDQSQVDKLLSLQGKFCDDVIFNESERISRNQRILLRCEQERVKERRQLIEDRQKTLQKVIADVSRVAERVLITKLETQSIDKLCNSIPAFDQFASFAYSPSLSFSKLTQLTSNSHQLNSTIIDLVANSRLSERPHASKAKSDAKVAIGQIGIEYCRRLFPILMARPMLRWSDTNTKSLTPKFWQHLVLVANVTRMRLEAAGVEDSDCGILIGALRALGNFLIINHFTYAFEDALIEVMLHYRNSNQNELYYACVDVKPNTVFLSNVISKFESHVTRNLVQQLDWPTNVSHIKKALLEDLDQVPVLKRSTYGAALAQARAYAIYDGLSRSGIFNEKHKSFWFANVQISREALINIRMNMPGKMTKIL
ncbi:HDOD domain-containing protein [Vibrio hyugaensis]|uniref:HDOD domain-containing protein n=1 Tax=Vibrio hyugaensis TaxID=1534743 RepID=UPI003DA17544